MNWHLANNPPEDEALVIAIRKDVSCPGHKLEHNIYEARCCIYSPKQGKFITQPGDFPFEPTHWWPVPELP